jgi:hypothetical protein
LGTASAAWKKIKSLNKTKSQPLGTPHPNNEDNTTSNSCSDEEYSPELEDDIIVDYTTNGEIVIVYKTARLMEIWSVNPDGDCLDLIVQLDVNTENMTIVNFKVIDIDRFLFINQSANNKYSLITYTRSKFKTKFELPTILQSLKKLFVKSSNNYIIIGNDQGILYVYNYNLIPANTSKKLTHTKKDSCVPVVMNVYGQNSIKDEELVLQTSVNSKKNEPIFEIIDNWLVYSPTKTEYLHLKATSKHTNVQDTQDPFRPTHEVQVKKSTIFTPVKLPHKKPLVNRVLSSFSNNAIDGLFKLSALTVKNYKKNQVPADVSVSINSISKGISSLLYNTASTTANSIQKQAAYYKPNNNQIIKIVDLSNDKVLGVFKPPSGINNLSFSPYDLQLLQTNLKGDTFYMWDLYKLPQEISLVGTFNRGKTSAVVEEIFWFISYHQADIIDKTGKQTTVSGNNSGFGCITKATGSVHWFNTNYLSGNSDNLPNSYSGSKNFNGFLDSWILSSIGAKKFIPLPRNSHKNSQNDCNRNMINQLAVLDHDNQLKLVSTLNGSHMYKYDLPQVPVGEEFVLEKLNDKNESTNSNKNSQQSTQSSSLPSNISVSNLQGSKISQVASGTTKQTVLIKNENREEDTSAIGDNPLSQAEIETCSPFPSLVNNSMVEFATYEEVPNFEHGFGNELKVKVVKPFAKEPTNTSGTAEKEKILEGLIIDSFDPEQSEEKVEEK